MAPSTSPDVGRMKRDLAALVGIDTQNPPGGEMAAAAYLRDLLAAEGFDVSLSEYEPGRANVVARLENGGGKVFAFNTHMDVVPVGEGWSSDPLKLREADGRLYGRGACDCKGPLAAMLEAMRMLAAERQSWSGTLLGVFVGDEEVGSAGAKAYAAARPRIDYAVIGEPTSNATVTAHKGSLRPLVRVHGTPAHSGAPHLGDNAIYRAAALVGLIAEHHEALAQRDAHPLVGTASMTVTRINAGQADNIVPGICEMLIDRRMVPGEDVGSRQTRDRRRSFRWRKSASACGPRSPATARAQAERPRRRTTARSCSRASTPAARMAVPTPVPSASRAAAIWCIFVRWERKAR